MKKISQTFIVYHLVLLIILMSGTHVHGQSSISGTVNIYTPVTGIDTLTCPTTITVGSVSGYSVGNKVLIIQMKGCAFDSSNSSTFGSITNIQNTGNYEIATITAISGNAVSLNGKLLKKYSLSGFVQLVKVATYVTASVTSQLTCPAWNGSVGGVLIIDVLGNLSLSADIDVSGKGFRGGVTSNNPDGGCGSGSNGYFYPLVQGGFTWLTGGAQKGEGIGMISAGKGAGRGTLVTGGGGGNKHNTGGGGGSNFTSGGKGGNELSGCPTGTTGGIGGNSLSAYYTMTKLFMGGGGGRGDDNNAVGTAGEAGGGIAIIMCASISGNNYSMRANGNHVTGLAGSAADGAGGGGGGGMVFLQTTSVLSSFSVQANGGDGGSQNPSGYCAGPGGGGGTGTFLTNLPSVSSISWLLNPGAAGVMVSGGGSCINTTYGATAGATNSVGPLTSMSLAVTPNNNANIILSTLLSNSVICSGSTSSISASGANTYTWLPGSQTGSLLAIAPATTTQYTLLGSTGFGCNASITVTQPVTATPTLVAVSSGSICAGSSATLSAIGGTAYSWVNGLYTGSSITVSPAISTVYTLSSTNSGCTGTASVLQTVHINPTIAASPSTLSVCPAVNFSLLASGASTYTWMPSGSSGAVLNTSILASTVFTVTGTSTAGCSSSSTSTVTLKPSPTLSFNTFSITCASLGSATVNANGGIGPFTYTWTPTLQTSSAVANLFPGNYSVMVQDNGTGCVFTRTTNFAPLVPLTGTVSSTPSLQCNSIASATAAIALSGGSGSQSYTWTSASGVQNTPAASNLPAGVNSVTVIDALTFCAVTRTFNVTQPPALTITVVQSSPSVCLGGAISYTASASGGIPAYTYSWVTGAAGPSKIVSESLPDIYIYTIGINDANQCAAQATVSGLFIINPVVTVSDVTICPLDNAILTGTGAVNYLWSTGFSGNPLVVSPLTASQYTVTGTTAGCSGSATASVFVKPGPTPSFTGTNMICQDDSLQLTGFGGSSYIWTSPQNAIVLNQNYILATAQPSNGGTFTLQVTASNSCSASMTLLVIVYSKPMLVVSGSTVCAGSALLLNANYLSGVSYSWAGQQAFSSNQQSPQIPSATPLMSGIYSLTATSKEGCVKLATVSASVVQPPTVLITGDSVVCSKNTFSLQSNGGGTNTWIGPNLFYSPLPIATIPNAQPASAGEYTLTSIYGPCTVKAFKTVTVMPLPTPLAIAPSSVCENNYFQLTASGGNSYTWHFPNGAITQGAIINAGPATMLSAGNYTLLAKDVNGCEAKTTASVDVIPAPVITAGNATACAGGGATLSAQGGLLYNWTGPSNFSAAGAVVSIPIVSVATSGVYTVIATDANFCSGSTTVLVSTLPYALPNVTAGSSEKNCVGSNIRLQGGGDGSYEWTGPGGFISKVDSPNFIAKDSSAAGIYTLTVRNASNCVASATVNVKVLLLPKASIVASKTEACVPFCSGFELIPSNTGNKFVNQLFFMNDEFLGGQANTRCFSDPGQYQIRASFSDTNGCANSATINVRAYQKPKGDFYYAPLNPMAGIDEVHFYDASSGYGINSYSWLLNSDVPDTTHEKNSVYVYEKAGQFMTVLLVKNIHGCVDTVIKPIIVAEEFGLYVPDAFTPNGDGLNDVFLPKGQGIKSYHLRIYNRWGQQLFNSREMNNAWDGTIKGEACKVDSYIWSITVIDGAGKTRELQGHVALVK